MIKHDLMFSLVEDLFVSLSSSSFSLSNDSHILLSCSFLEKSIGSKMNDNI